MTIPQLLIVAHITNHCQPSTNKSQLDIADLEWVSTHDFPRKKLGYNIQYVPAKWLCLNIGYPPNLLVDHHFPNDE
jgi:hypothetical protein